MYMPRVQGEQTSKNVQIEFRGYNHNLFVQENEFYDEQNMSSEYYPVLSPREKLYYYDNIVGRGSTLANIESIVEYEGHLFWTTNDGNDYYYGFVVETFHPVSTQNRMLIKIGAYVAIFPDKYLFNMADQTHGSMEATYTSPNTAYNGNAYDRTVGFWLCDSNGKALQNVTVSNTAPNNPADGKYWVDTSGGPESVEDHVLKRWSESMNSWITQTNVYTRIYATGLGRQFSPGDNITFSNIVDNNITLSHLNGDHIIHSCSPNGITIPALIDGRDYYFVDDGKSVSVERLVPNMDYVCAHNNRLWGCSSDNHEIYASKLGDFKNWKSYAGISTDSYAMTVGGEGEFTGCASFHGNVLFFKENQILKIYGTKPSNFQLTTAFCYGVERGCSKTICNIQDVLYYCSPFGICSYDGSAPQNISIPLGKDKNYSGQAGSDGKNYIVCLANAGQDAGNHGYNTFVFDPLNKIWSKWESGNAYDNENFFLMRRVTTRNNPLLCFTRSGRLYSFTDRFFQNTHFMPTSWETHNDEPDWFSETGDIAYYDTNRRYISKIQIRTELEQGSVFKVALQYDHGPWEDAYTQTAPDEASARKTYLIPIIPHRCDTVRMKFYGTGGCKIFAVSKHYEQGSEI